MRTRITALAVAIAALAPPAQAATWSEPQVIAPPPEASNITLSAPDIAFAPDGTVLGVWSSSQRYDRPGTYGVGMSLATRPPGGPWSQPRNALVSFEGRVAIDRSGRIGFVGAEQDDPDPGHVETVAVREYVGAVTREGGGIAPGRVIWAGSASKVVSARAESGAHIAAWLAWNRRTRRQHVHAAVKPAGGRWSRPTRLSRGRIGYQGPAVSINSRGDAVVAWQDGRAMYARVAPRARRLGGRRTVARPADDSRVSSDLPLAASIDKRGQTLIAWGQRPGQRVELAAARSSGHRFRRPFVLDAWHADPDNPAMQHPYPVAVTGGGEDTLLAWTSRNPAHAGLRIATVDRRAARVTDIMPTAGGVGYDLTSLPDGRAAVAWSAADGIFAAVRPPGGTFGAAERVSAHGRGQRLAINPVDGQPTVGFTVDGRPAVSDRSP